MGEVTAGHGGERPDRGILHRHIPRRPASASPRLSRSAPSFAQVTALLAALGHDLFTGGPATFSRSPAPPALPLVGGRALEEPVAEQAVAWQIGSPS